AWYPGNNSQTQPLDTPARLGARIDELTRLTEDAKRDTAKTGVAQIVQDLVEWGAHKTQDGSARRMFTGASADMGADAAALEALCVGQISLRLGGASAEEATERIAGFGGEVIGKQS